jgi:hypothetical protein
VGRGSGGRETKKKGAGNLGLDVLAVRGAPSRFLEWGTITHTVMRREGGRWITAECV